MGPDTFYWAVFAVFALQSVGLMWQDGMFTSKAAGSEASAAFKSFRNNYLLVYSLQMLGDWLQGPYVYALYAHYGYRPAQIGQLFIAGFGSSLLFGTVVGALTDRIGRRNASLIYVITYSLSCVTKHSPNFWVLMLGRILGGIATSLLFSAFESWLVAEHFKRGFSEQALGGIFSWAVFLGNGLMAIVAGVLGNYLVDNLDLGKVAPFDAAIVAMLIGGGIITATWPENYGDQHSKDLGAQFVKAWNAIISDRAITLLGAMQAMFEASMYSFVFLWTMALSPNRENIKHGLIFMDFMTASMVGSFLAGMLMKRSHPEAYMKYVFALGAAALAVPAVININLEKDPSMEGKPMGLMGQVQMVAMCVFELCVGIFWPSMMKMRSGYVPEELRATIINIFRIPLNIFVCVVLANVELFPMYLMFGLCCGFLGLSAVCQVQLERYVSGNPTYTKVVDSEGGASGAPAVGGH